MKRVLFLFAILAAVMIIPLPAEGSRPRTETISLWVNMHCASCQQKIMENLSFEKGVKDIRIDLEKKTVDVTYNIKKTDPGKIIAAIEGLGYEVKKLSEATLPVVSEPNNQCQGEAGTAEKCKGKSTDGEHKCCKEKSGDHKCQQQSGNADKEHECSKDQAKKEEGAGHKCNPQCKGESDKGTQPHNCTQEKK
jgi:mercuric ion binding protein